MIALVDFGIGNLRSVEKALETVGAEVHLTSDPNEVQLAEKVVLPGVGAFGDGMAGLRTLDLIDSLTLVVQRQIPLLGICLGMQFLFEASEEHGNHTGLGFLLGKVRRFPHHCPKIPHTGWNSMRIIKASPLLEGVEQDSYAYFNHSYYCAAKQEDVLAYTEYGIQYPSIAGSGSIYGVQFHPEKSQQVGLVILRNFVERC